MAVCSISAKISFSYANEHVSPNNLRILSTSKLDSILKCSKILCYEAQLLKVIKISIFCFIPNKSEFKEKISAAYELHVLV